MQRCTKDYVLSKRKQNSDHNDKEVTNILNDLGFEEPCSA
jgi:hypothetical protein